LDFSPQARPRPQPRPIVVRKEGSIAAARHSPTEGNRDNVFASLIVKSSFDKKAAMLQHDASQESLILRRLCG
jgi:hypothetical protein